MRVFINQKRELLSLNEHENRFVAYSYENSPQSTSGQKPAFSKEEVFMVKTRLVAILKDLNVKI